MAKRNSLQDTKKEMWESRIRELEAELAEARRDGARLDFAEKHRLDIRSNAIRQMTAAEKTRLLAERVMGWCVKQANSGKWVALVHDGDYVSTVGLCEYSWTFKKWSPLTDLAHAGEVLEAMRAKGWIGRILTEPDTNIVEFYEASGPRRVFTDDVVLPTAICHAALLAEEVKEEEL